MEISYSHRFVFIHVYRAAGQSVSAALRPYVHVPAPRRIDRFPFVRRIGFPRDRKALEHRAGHMKARELRDALPDVFETSFKFAFVRNPWDWQVSIYHYVRQNERHPYHDLYKRAFGSFDEYLEWRIREAGPELQSDFVLDEAGDLIVDFVGRFDTLDRDFADACRRIGIECALPHRNRSDHAVFRDYYTPATRELVAAAYAEDVERFGFEFDRPTTLPPLVPPGGAVQGEGSAGNHLVRR